jgi:uncharacterized zinc-type alcohol dehydrogenase-like protein
MQRSIKAYAALSKGAPLSAFEYELGQLGDEQVEIKISHCGICHSDLSMLDNDWGMSTYPFVAGHEIVGTIVAAGRSVKRVKLGDRVGMGWYSGSCQSCPSCLAGDHNLCASAEQTIVGRFGGFADRIRCDWIWATPLPDALDSVSAGPLFCGGITVFNPIMECGVQPTDRVGVIGIGGLGHMALQFLNKWGCEVTAFTSSESKRAEALQLGAHHVVSSTDVGALKQIQGSLNFILCTVNVALHWNAIFSSLAPKGRLHVVGAVLEPIPVPAFTLIGGQKSLSGSPLGSPSTTSKMLDFCARHSIAPQIETFALSNVNEALDHLRNGKARYRIVLENDFD